VCVLPEEAKSYMDSLLPDKSFELRENAVSNIMEHPPAFKTSGVNVNVSVPMYLTK